MKGSQPGQALVIALIAILINAGLLTLAFLLAKERGLSATGLAPQAVNLVQLSPPEPPRPPEAEREPEPPTSEEKPPFVPDVSPPRPGMPDGIDLGIVIDLGDLRAQRPAGEFKFEATDLDQQPRATVRIPPPYPFRAQQRAIEGSVRVRFLVRADGTVEQVSILEAEPEGVFEDCVLTTVPRWKFEPGRIAGQPVSSWIVTTITFDMD